MLNIESQGSLSNVGTAWVHFTAIGLQQVTIWERGESPREQWPDYNAMSNDEAYDAFPSDLCITGLLPDGRTVRLFNVDNLEQLANYGRRLYNSDLSRNNMVVNILNRDLLYNIIGKDSVVYARAGGTPFFMSGLLVALKDTHSSFSEATVIEIINTGRDAACQENRKIG